MSDLLDRLTKAVREDAAIRRIRKLQPVGGPGDKIFPPTYPGERRTDPPRHVFERRRIGAANVLCVLIDSVQSQANRLEEALKATRDEAKASFPVIAVDFTKTGLADLGSITTLDAPHRVFDAIIRDSELDGVRFRDTDFGKRLIEAKPQHARALFEVSPTALVFGAWNSTGEGGGLGAKFPRVLVSEIIGVGVAVEGEKEHEQRPSGQRTGSRIDPLGIRSGVAVYKAADGDWTLDKPKKDAKAVKPSEVNHSNIAPTVQPLGVSVDHALHTFTLSCAALRRLRFASSGGALSDADVAAQTALAALGLLAAVAQDRNGYFLRSRCDLVPESSAPDRFEIVGANGATEGMALSFADACRLLQDAAKAAARLDVTWRDSDVLLRPKKDLVELVKASRAKAIQGEAEPADES